MLLSVKSLSKDDSKSLKILIRVFYVAMGIVTILVAVSGVLNFLHVSTRVTGLIYNLSMAIFIIFMIVTTSYYLIKMRNWLFGSEFLKSYPVVRKKNRYLIALTSLIGVYVIMVAIFFVMKKTPWVLFGAILNSLFFALSKPHKFPFECSPSEIT